MKLNQGDTSITVSNSKSDSTAYVCLMQMVDASTYNSDGNLAQETDALGNTTTYAYNNLGQPKQQASPTNSAPLGPVYDKAGNVLSDTDLLGNVTNYGYLCPCQLAGADFLRPVCRRGSQGTGRFNFAHSSMAA